jgi:hypothetical protein
MRAITILAAAVCAAGLILLPGNGAEAQKGGKGTPRVGLTPSKVNPWGQGGTRDHRPWRGVTRDHRGSKRSAGFCRRLYDRNPAAFRGSLSCSGPRVRDHRHEGKIPVREHRR